MDFRGQYLTYSDYAELGGQLSSEMPFKLFELEARTIINNFTMNRLINLKYADLPQEVKLCTFNLVESLAFSGSYKDADTKEKQLFLNNLVSSHLQNVIVNNVPVLYRGI